MKDRATFSKADLRDGLDNGQFEVYYQPIIDLDTNEVVSGEALVRWNHPRLGFLHPMSFIMDAEKTGMIFELGEFVMREACLQSIEWKKSGYPFHRISVNLSLAQLSDQEFVKKVKTIIKGTGVDPKDLTLEITESVAMSDPEITINTLIELKYLGIHIVLDDFGAGYSSLSHLQHFPVDGLKIDGVFIQRALEGTWGAKLIHSIIVMARELDLYVVVEGVETIEQLNILKRMKDIQAQGFYFTHSLPADEYKEWCTYYMANPALRV